MIINLHAAVTINGFIADENGNEDFFTADNWESFLNCAKKHDAVVYGNRTMERVKTWGEDYTKLLSKTKILVLSAEPQISEHKNVIYVTSFKELIEKAKELNLVKILISGGKSIYEQAMRNLNIENFIFNINFIPLKIGIQFPYFEDAFKKLKVKYSKEKTENYVQVYLSNQE